MKKKKAESKYIIVDSMEQVDKLIEACKYTKTASVDFETTSLKFFQDSEYPLILGVSFQPGSSWIIPLGHQDSLFKDNWRKPFNKFCKEVIENPDITKWAWNLKFEYKWFYRYGYKMRGRIFDAMLMKYCLDEERPHGLKQHVALFFPEFAGYAEKLKDEDDDKVDWWKKRDFKDLCQYCGIDADLTLRAGIYLEKRIIQKGFYNLFRSLLMPSTRLLAECEIRGTLIDVNYLEKLIDEYKVKIDNKFRELMGIPEVRKFQKSYKKYHLRELIKKIKLEIAEIEENDAQNADRLIKNRENKIKDFLNGKLSKKDSYEGLNFGSPKQLIQFLFESKYGLRLKPTGKTKTGQPSTGEDAIKKLEKADKSKFITKLLEYRKLTKLNSTYVVGMYNIMDKATHRVHTSFRVNGTVTGRLSSRDPNLQNIPRGTTSKDIKTMFIAPPGFVLVEFDYGQAELRVIAELAKDEAMIDIFNRGWNIHVATACKMFKGEYEEVKSKLKIADSLGAAELAKKENKDLLKWAKYKKRGKSMNFSILYLQGDKATAEQMSEPGETPVTESEAKHFKKLWFKGFPAIEPWIKKQIRFARKHEYVETNFGRRRRLPDINCGQGFFESEAERQSVNMPMQSESNDFGLMGQITIRERIKEAKDGIPLEVYQIYTVHDSIGYYARPNGAHKIVKPIVKICENPNTMKYFGFEYKYVKMKMSPEVGINWANLHDYDDWADYNKLLDLGNTIKK